MEKRVFGLVMNLSNVLTDGSHWVTINIDFRSNIIFYFDSFGVIP